MSGLSDQLPITVPGKGGNPSSRAGKHYVIGIAGVASFVLGVGAAIYLEEYATRQRFTRIIQINIANLAGVPSIVYGILGLEIFVRSLYPGQERAGRRIHPGPAGASRDNIASQEAIRAVPPSIREGGFALGASRWQAVWHLVLPRLSPAY